MTGELTSHPHFWNRWRIGGWGLAAGLLAIPLILGLVGDGIPWTISDYVFATLVVGIIGLGVELAVRASASRAYRGGAALAFLTGFAVLWVNGSVGIIGNEDHPANLMFFAVVGIAVAGSFMTRFRTRGMAVVMASAAAAQFAVPVIAMAIWAPPITVDLFRTLAFNAVFAVLWLASAALFRAAGKSSPAVN